MGLRFRKSISLGKFFRLNLSKSGASLGIGPRGLNINVGPRGIRKTIGIPGTGLSYQESSSWTKAAQASIPAEMPATRAESNSGGGAIAAIAIVVITLLVIIIGGGSSTTDSKSSVVSPSKVEAAQIPVAASKPMPDRPLTKAEVIELQTLLRKQGFDAGSADGIVGPKTNAAVQSFVRARGLKLVTAPSLKVLEAARAKRK